MNSSTCCCLALSPFLAKELLLCERMFDARIARVFPHVNGRQGVPAPTFIATRTLVGCPAKLRYTGRQEKAALAPDFGDAYNHRVRSKKGQKHMDSQDFQDPGTYQTLEKVVGRLLGPGGCPWDREQTHQSLKRNLLEECYEFMEAIDSGNPKHMVEELGDIVLSVRRYPGHNHTPEYS